MGTDGTVNHMDQIRKGVKQRAREGAGLSEIYEWLDSNEFRPSERQIGRRLAKAEVRRARRKRLALYIETLAAADEGADEDAPRSADVREAAPGDT